MSKEKIIALVEAGVLLVVGILFCFGLATDVLSVIVGAGLIIAGVVFLAISFVGTKSLLTNVGFGGGLLLALGIYCLAATAVEIIFTFVPYLLIVGGSIIILDGIFGKFVNKHDVLVVFIIKLVIGIALVVIGILLLTVPEFAQAVSIIFGVTIILLAIYAIVMILLDKDGVKTVTAK